MARNFFGASAADILTTYLTVALPKSRQADSAETP
jgi:hypothetical protein